MVIVEDLFKSRLEAKPALHEKTNTKIVPEFTELKNRLLESGQWYLDYVTNLSIENRQKIIPFTFKNKTFR